MTADFHPAFGASTLSSSNTPDHVIRPLHEWCKYEHLWEKPEPFVQDILYPGMVTLIYAREKMGKTSFVAQMAAALSRGGEFLGASVPSVRVLWYSLDEWFGLTVQRLRDLVADEGLLASHQKPTSAGDFRRALTAYRPDVIVFDSLGDLWEGKVDSNDHDSTRAFLKPYIDEAREIMAAMVIIYHQNASGTKYVGATSIGAMVDAPLSLDLAVRPRPDSDPSLDDDGRRVLQGRTRYGPVRIPLMYVDGRYQRGDAQRPPEDRTLVALAGAPCSQNKLRDIVGISDSRMGRLMKSLQDRGLAVYDEKQWQITTGGLARLAGNTPNHSSDDENR